VAAHIGFDDVDAGTVITDQYSDLAVFGTENPESANEAINNYDFGQTENYLSTYFYGGGGTVLDFASPVRNLSFLGIAVNDSGVVATARVTTKGAVVTDYELVGGGDWSVPWEFTELLELEGIVRLEIVEINDPYEIGLEDFRFEIQVPAE